MLVLVYLYTRSWFSFRDLFQFLALSSQGLVVQDGIPRLLVNCRSSLRRVCDLASADLVGVLSLSPSFILFGHGEPSEAVTGLSSGCGSYAIVQARAWFW